MGLRINQNIAAQNAYRNLSVTDGQMSKSLEKLSSGFRINRAADDAAGLSISEGLRAQTGGLKVAVRNAQDGISVVQTAEGALNEVTSMLQRMRDLAVQASSGGSMDPEALDAAQKEFDQLNSELTRIGDTTAFGKSKLLDGSFGKTNAATPTGTKVTAMPAGAVAFTIDDIDGEDVSALAITVSATIPANASAKEVADTLNTAIKKALTDTTANPLIPSGKFSGNEIKFGATVANDGTGASFTLSGAKSFSTTDGAGTPLALLELGVGASGTVAGNSGTFQIGANATEKLDVSISKISAGDLGTNVVNLVTDPDAAITLVDNAIKTVSAERASLGAYQNRFEHTINNLNVSVENLSASESRIRDTDMAQEMVAFTRNQILTQAGTSMLSQANQASQNVLSLLR
ncbi:MAG TPA: flagellin [Propionibacteriaceae bacterium]|jgi:flagellin